MCGQLKRELYVDDDVKRSNSMDIVMETSSVLGNHFHLIRVDGRQKRKKNLLRFQTKMNACDFFSAEEFLCLNYKRILRNEQST